jgi:hypothetical protein
MIIDLKERFSNAQDVTTAAASTNAIDTKVVGGRNLGAGEPLFLVVTVDTALTGASVTCVVALEGDSTTTFSPDATLTLFTIPALTAAGKKFIARLQPNSDIANASNPLAYQYLQLKYTPTGGTNTLSTGAFTAFLCDNIDSYKAFADDVTITA